MKIMQRCVFVVGLSLIFTFFCFAQEKNRKVEKISINNEPVELIDLEVDGKTFRTDEQIQSDKYWLKDLGLRIKNTSGKTITYLKLELEVAPIGKMERGLRLPLEFGQMPENIVSSFQPGLPKAKSKSLKINESEIISLTSTTYDFLLKYMKEKEIEEIEEVKAILEFVIFDDGTAWSKGYEMRQNESNPKQWDIIREWQKGLSAIRNFQISASLVNNNFPLDSCSSLDAKKKLASNKASFFFANFSVPKLSLLQLRAVSELERTQTLGTCVYFQSTLTTTCSSQTGTGCNLYCVADQDNGTRNQPQSNIRRGIMFDFDAPCRSLDPSCGCASNTGRVKRWSSVPSPENCTDRPCSEREARICDDNDGVYNFLTCICEGGGGGGGGGNPPCPLQGCYDCMLCEMYHGGGSWDEWNCRCGATPILIDVAGNGFNLTNVADGVLFELDLIRQKERRSWTVAGSDDAWLVLDRNNNGTIDDGRELFGSATPQPDPPTGIKRNGFLALAEYDKSANGGNNDNQIDARDTIFSQLKLWQDINHNGISEATELQSLSSSEVRIIELDYRESRRIDEHGNKFKYRARVRDVRGAQVGRWAWDVILMSQ